MNIFILTIGTRGDVQPHIALAQGLHDAGHTVTVCTSPRYKAPITGRGINYAHLSDDIIALVESAEGRAAIEDMRSLISGIRAALRVGLRTGQIQRDLVWDGWAAAQEADPDLIIYHPKMTIGLHYAEKLGIPAIIAPLYPLFLPTRAYPNLGLPRLDFLKSGWGRGIRSWYNELTHRLVIRVVSAVSGWLYAGWRKAQGLPSALHSADVTRTSRGTRVPFLNGWSEHVAPNPPDWPRRNVLTSGYWFLDRPANRTPPTAPTALTTFLESGPPPVYVGFGSMAGRDPERTTRLVVEALQQAGLRGVLASGWGGMASAKLPASVYQLDAVPHDWLFPRVAVVVHHGGAGTTAAGLRAGRPTIVCPFFGDQTFWGRRVHALGAGPAPIPQAELTPARLARALREVTETPSIRQQAAALGATILRENAMVKAVAFVEEVGERGGAA